MRVMELFAREFGEAGRLPLVILHGLLGSSRNWQAAARALGERYHVHCLDLRNHGVSPWAEPHSYDAMVADVLEWMEQALSRRPVLMGHSMGGKVAMKLACEAGERLEKLVVVDIQPRAYKNNHYAEFEGMRAVPLSELKSRGEAENALEAYVSDWAMRKFLITNLERDEEGAGFRWAVNLDAIEASLDEIEENPLAAGERYAGDTLFVMGGRSPYFKADEVAALRDWFPASAVEVIAESGHNPHFECRESFVAVIDAFLQR